MGFSSQSGQVGIRTQAVKGVYSDPGAVAPDAGIFMRHRGGAISSNRELLIPDPEIGGNRDIPDAYLGPIAFSGEYEFYTRMESIATLLKGALGASSTSVAGTTPGTDLVGTHTISSANTLPWLSVEEAIGNGYEVFNYVDCMVNTLSLEVEAADYLMGTVGLVALSGTTGHTRTAAPDVDTTPMLVGSTITVSYDGVQLPAKSFSIEINNNLEDDDFRLGSVFLGDLTPKRREITLSVTIRPENADLWKAATFGSAASDTPLAGAAVKEQVVFHAESYEVIGTTIEKYTLDLTLPTVAIQPFAVEPEGDDIIEHDIEFQALRPDPTVDIITATVKNGIDNVR